jgi:hypothetical protein
MQTGSGLFSSSVTNNLMVIKQVLESTTSAFGLVSPFRRFQQSSPQFQGVEDDCDD